MLGLDLETTQATSEQELQPQLEKAAARMLEHGAHTVVEAFADCLSCVADFERRMAAGERP